MKNNLLLSPENNDQSNFLTVAGIVTIGILAVFLSPLLLLSASGGYFLYFSFYHKEERRILRTTVFLFCFGLFLFSIAKAIDLFLPEVISYLRLILFKNSKISSEQFKHYFDLMWAFVPVVGAILISKFLHKKWTVIKKPFVRLRILFLWLTVPVRFLWKSICQAPKDIRWIRYAKYTFAFFALSILQGIAFNSFMATGLVQLASCYITLYFILGAYSCISQSKKSLESETGINRIKDKDAIEIGTFDDSKKKMKLSWDTLNRHVHVVGQPGMGKSVFLRNIYADSILNNKSLLMIDLKADVDVVEEITELARIAKRENGLCVIDLSSPHNSIGYNPLLRGNASELKDKIMNSLKWSEVFYEKMAESVLLTIMRGFVALRDYKPNPQTTGLVPTFLDLWECLKYPAAIEILAARLPKEFDLLARDLRMLAQELKEKSNLKDILGIRTDIEVMVKSEWGEILAKPDSIDLLDALLNKKIIFVKLDGQAHKKTAARFAQMLISDLQAVSGYIVSNLSQETRPKITVIVDEFAQIISDEAMASSFAEVLNRCRGSGIGVVVAHQSLGDFETPRACARILDTTATTVAFAQKNPESCEILASICGTIEAEATTEQTERNLFGKGRTGLGTVKATREFIIHPDVFKNLGVGQAVYSSKDPTINEIIQVKYITIPKVTGLTPTGAAKAPKAGSACTMLDLQGARLSGRIPSLDSFDSRFQQACEADI